MLLCIDNVYKNFGGIEVLIDVSLSIERGQTHALIGPNGAGKTTLFNLMTGIIRPGQGRITFKGTEVNRLAAHEICQLGISRTFQNTRLFKNMTLLENIMVGRHIKTQYNLLTAMVSLPSKWHKEGEILKKALEFLAFVRLSNKANYLASELSYGEQRRLEMARALATEPELLLLDEPTAGMTEAETEDIVELIHRIEDMGITVFFIEHDMRFVMGISKIITVLNFGNVIAEGAPGAIQSNPKVIEAYLGSREKFHHA